ncbi:MAG TPA: hypothetical protein VI757_15815 [Bacteroidia bacterium]|nr:hypothetical protein [Bacteroidia bacterium]
MKRGLTALFIFSLAVISCKKENPSSPILECGVTGITGPVRYYLTTYDKSLFISYKLFHTLIFVDSTTNDTNCISYSSDAQVWDETSTQSQTQGDTVDVGEIVGIAYNYGTTDIGHLEYIFRAYTNLVDSMTIIISNAASVSFWTLNLVDTTTINTSGYTPFVVLDSITFLSQTFYDVYLLQNGNSLSPADSSNNCFYTKANGIIAFTDKLYNKFWIRTNY